MHRGVVVIFTALTYGGYMKRLTIYKPTAKQRQALEDYFMGRKSTREVAPILGCSHQQVINITARMAQDAAQKNKKVLQALLADN